MIHHIIVVVESITETVNQKNSQEVTQHDFPHEQKAIKYHEVGDLGKEINANVVKKPLVPCHMIKQGNLFQNVELCKQRKFWVELLAYDFDEFSKSWIVKDFELLAYLLFIEINLFDGWPHHR